MKFLIIGLGSMGKRRIRNLHYLGEKDIIAFDLKEERRKEVEEKYEIKTFDNIDDALKENPDVFIISTPPNYHIEYELLAAENNKHFFCEAGISIDKLDELIKICNTKNIVAAPSCTFRFKESINKVKELVDSNKIGKIAAVTYHMGQYLPNWHIGEDISKFYVGKRETSATREMIPFELEWMTWMFGDIKKLSSIKNKTNILPVDIDDVFSLNMQFEDGTLGHVLIEVISRPFIRRLRLVGEKGSIEWDWDEDGEVVKLYDVKTKKWIKFKEEEKPIREEGYVAKENMYINEIRAFLNAIKGKEKWSYSLEDDLKMLKLLERCEKNAL